MDGPRFWGSFKSTLSKNHSYWSSIASLKKLGTQRIPKNLTVNHTSLYGYRNFMFVTEKSS